MIDLTAIKTPFGLLDRETQEALKAHGGPYEFWPAYNDDWATAPKDSDCWINRMVYRVKPQPPKPREWWISLNDHQAYLCHPNDNAVVMDGHVRVREVIDNA